MMQCRYMDFNSKALDVITWIELRVKDMFLGIARPTLFIFEPSDKSVVIVSKHGDTNANISFCKKNDIEVMRMNFREGGPSYNAPGETIFYLFYPTESKRKEVNEKHSRLVVEILEKLGVTVTVKGNNIRTETKKIGIAGHHMRGKYVTLTVHILRDFDFNIAEKAIKEPDLHERLTTLKLELGRDVSHREVVDIVMSVFENGLNLQFIEPTQTQWSEDDLQRFSIERKRHKSESWLHTGKWSPVKDYWRPK